MSPRFERRPDKRTGTGGRGAARPARQGGWEGGRDRGDREPRRSGGTGGTGGSEGREPRRVGGPGWDRARPAGSRPPAGSRSQGERGSFSRRPPDRASSYGREPGSRDGGERGSGTREWPRPGARRDSSGRPPGRRFDTERGAGRGGAGRGPDRGQGTDRRFGSALFRSEFRAPGRFQPGRDQGRPGQAPRRIFEPAAEPAAAGPGAERNAAERHGDDLPTDLIWGRHSAQATLESGRPIHRIWCTPEMRFSPRFLQLLREAKSSGVLVEEVTWARLGQLTDGAVHQGIVLQTAAAETLDLPTLIDGCRGIGEPPLLMALDGITDPHNLGAIARSAEALGAHGLVLPQRRSAGLTGSVAKVAAGALEHLPVARVVNLNRALDSLKQEGYRVIGLASEGSVSLEEADLEGPLVIVTGSEGDGLAMLTRKHCDQLVSVPLRGATPSLNASVATALLLYEVARRSWMKGLKGGQPAPRLQRPQMPVPAPRVADPSPELPAASAAGADASAAAEPAAAAEPVPAPSAEGAWLPAPAAEPGQPEPAPADSTPLEPSAGEPSALEPSALDAVGAEADDEQPTGPAAVVSPDPLTHSGVQDPAFATDIQL